MLSWKASLWCKAFLANPQLGFMEWVFLFAAIVFEVVGTMSMKFAAGFAKLLPSVMVFVCYGVALALVTMALRRIDISVAYTIWSGVGTVLVALIGVFYFGEQMTMLKLGCIALIMVGVAGLRWMH